jgi:hypothetical protein
MYQYIKHCEIDSNDFTYEMLLIEWIKEFQVGYENKAKTGDKLPGMSYLMKKMHKELVTKLNQEIEKL